VPLTSPTFSIDVQWHGGPGGPLGKFAFEGESPFHVQGGKVVGEQARNPARTIKSEEKISVDIQRDVSVDFDFRVKINGYLEHFYLPAYTPKEHTFQVRNTNTIVANSVWGPGGNEGAHINIPCIFLPPANEEFVVGTEHLEVVNEGESSHSEIESVEPRRIFWRVAAGTNSKAHGAQSRAFVSVITASNTKAPESNAFLDGCLKP
jgi:hypothetical protein